MSEQETTNHNFLKALNTIKSEYREALLEVCSDEEIKYICECILKTFENKIDIKETKESVISICKLNCFFSSDIK